MPDGPIEELLDVVGQFRTDPGSLRAVVDDLAELRRKLPSELTTIKDPENPRLSDVEWLATLLGQAQPMLLDLLRKTQGSGADGRGAT